MVPNFEKSLKQAKRKNTIRIILITIATILIAIPILYLISNKIPKQQSDKLNAELMIRNAVKEPNIQIDSQVLANSTATGGEVVSNRSKNISGYVVPWSTIRAKYSLFNYQIDHNELLPGEYSSSVNSYSYDRQTKQKVAEFYHPDITYKEVKLPNDLKKVDGKKEEVAEMALSFEEPKTIKEIEKDIPSGVNLCWLYVFSSTEEKEVQGRSNDVYGFEYSKDEGDEALDYFIDNLKEWNQPFEDKEIKNFINQKKEMKELPILGVLVTGQNSDLKKLEKMPNIKASSVGVSVPKTSYIEVEK
ncbi:anti sigma factor C-terminal domain-containing protein [Vagococcus carniphilus]|uniref:sigma factor regulator N-terminal domain-containing protein n=1 Tax=Vagococcus carniphilus TaxID=218144 RepID=UPI00288DE910|nr:sigma factor regulator N-terminal domain-containing protein [Vagococcus carniphilus]MDT2849411.1 anti sigma factor C-terminal domain-containing protein [Vagococcus carniphilus]